MPLFGTGRGRCVGPLLHGGVTVQLPLLLLWLALLLLCVQLWRCCWVVTLLHATLVAAQLPRPPGASPAAVCVRNGSCGWRLQLVQAEAGVRAALLACRMPQNP